MTTLISISHHFDTEDEWAGFEYAEQVSEYHVRVLRYDRDGRLMNSKHIFSDATIGTNSENFVAYMNERKVLASNDNWRRRREHVQIDLQSSLDEAKILNKS